MKTRNTKFLAEYYHDGSWWVVEIYADDIVDAGVICKAHNLRLLGESKLELTRIPTFLGWLRALFT